MIYIEQTTYLNVSEGQKTQNDAILEERLKLYELEKQKIKKYVHTVKDWEKAKEEAKIIYQQSNNHDVIVPKCLNFNEELQINAPLLKKEIKILCTAFEDSKKDKDGYTKGTLRFIGEARPTGYNDTHIKKEIKKAFYESGATGKGFEYILYSEQPITADQAQIIGTEIKLRDEERIGDTTSIQRNLNLVIVKKVKTLKISKKRVLESINGLETQEDFRANVFSVLQQPEWFEQMISAWLLSAKSNYPLHILTCDKENFETAQGGVGKSELMERLNLVCGNERPPFDLTSGTIKGLTVSYSERRPQLGYILTQKHCAYIDEVFKVFEKTDRNNVRETFFAELTSILENRDRTGQSGNTPDVTLRPRTKCFFTGNLPKQINTLYDLTDWMHTPVIERMITYLYTDDHKNFINKRRAEVDHLLRKGITKKTELNLKDFFNQSYETTIDYNQETQKQITELFEKYQEKTQELRIEKFIGQSTGYRDHETEKRSLETQSQKIGQIYRTRYHHHIANLIDGLTKLNSINDYKKFVEKNGTQKKTWEIQPTSLEFEQAENILKEIIRSW